MLDIGQRVNISPNCTWACSELGTVTYPPSSFARIGITYDLNDYTRTVHGWYGPVVSYYVEFDEPQYDADGDGPYRGGEIEEEYLIPIEEDN